MYFVSPCLQRADRRVLDVAGRVEVGLALRQADHVFPFGDHPARHGGNGDGQAGLDAVEAVRRERHGRSPGGTKAAEPTRVRAPDQPTRRDGGEQVPCRDRRAGDPVAHAPVCRFPWPASAKPIRQWLGQFNPDRCRGPLASLCTPHELAHRIRPAEDPHPVHPGGAREPVASMPRVPADDLPPRFRRDPQGLPELRSSYAYPGEGAP